MALSWTFPSDPPWNSDMLSGDFYSAEENITRGVCCLSASEAACWDDFQAESPKSTVPWGVCCLSASEAASWDTFQAASPDRDKALDVQEPSSLLQELEQQQKLLSVLETEVATSLSKECVASELLAQTETYARSEAAAAEAATANASAIEIRVASEASELREQMVRDRESFCGALALSESRCCEVEAERDEAVSRAAGLEEEMVAASVEPCMQVLYASPLLIEGRALRELAIEAEILGITEALSGKMALKVDVATPTTLRNAVSQPGLWLHISMHCFKSKSNSGALLLEAGCGAKASILFEKQLEDLLKAGDGARIDFVFLSACQSDRLAPSFIAAGVKHVVSCTNQVKDIDAQQFARCLYFELANGKDLQDAFDIASQVSQCSGNNGQYRLDSDGSKWPVKKLLLDVRPKFDKPVHGQLLQGLPRQVEDFGGRLEVIDRVLTCLATRRVVILHCQSPFGRTATLTQIARYVSLPGRSFAGRVAFWPQQAHGGLLIVDDGDDLLAGEVQLQLRRHLERDGAALLMACRSPCSDPFDGHVKAINIELPPLRPGEAAELFLKRVQRPLLASDLITPAELLSQGDAPHRILAREEAWRLLQGLLVVAPWGGEPGSIRRAAGSICEGSSVLNGSLLGLCPQLCDAASLL